MTAANTTTKPRHVEILEREQRRAAMKAGSFVLVNMWRASTPAAIVWIDRKLELVAVEYPNGEQETVGLSFVGPDATGEVMTRAEFKTHGETKRARRRPVGSSTANNQDQPATPDQIVGRVLACVGHSERAALAGDMESVRGFAREIRGLVELLGEELERAGR